MPSRSPHGTWGPRKRDRQPGGARSGDSRRTPVLSRERSPLAEVLARSPGETTPLLFRDIRMSGAGTNQRPSGTDPHARSQDKS